MTELVLALSGGGRARLHRTDGDDVELVASRAFPPGSTLHGEAPGLGSMRVKVRACKKDGDEFRVAGRFVNLSREQRARLLTT
jgi:hypothetical protein